jgi:glutamate synthase (ferredoxin)
MSTTLIVLLSILGAIVLFLGLVTIYDLRQKNHAILRNFPIIGHLRYILEVFGPELRQYIVTSDTEERPFNRDQRRWVYASAKQQNNYFGFGTSEDLERSSNYLIVKHSAFPIHNPHPGEARYDPLHKLPAGKVLGATRGRPKAFRPESVVNISGMSFGSLSANAVMALNQGAKIAGCLQSTGEGSLSPYHQRGGDLIWQLGTGYFGARTPDGHFDLARFKDVVAANPVRAIEIKLSQGAKPGLGGLLPGAKVTPQIAAMRGIPVGKDCVSPAAHTAFTNVDSMLDFVELLASETGLPVGIKSAVGDIGFWEELANEMVKGSRGVDFITIDGGEGGTGAAPLVFTDHVALPFKVGFSRVYRTFAERGIAEDFVFIGSGKLGYPESALLALALGCDMVNVAREAMLAIGCIQSQRCHTDRCPTGVATQNAWLMKGLDPDLKAARLANYIVTLRKELHALANACGALHPGLVTPAMLEIVDGHYQSESAATVFGYEPGWGIPSASDRAAITDIMSGKQLAKEPLAATAEPHGSLGEKTDIANP